MSRRGSTDRAEFGKTDRVIECASDVARARDGARSARQGKSDPPRHCRIHDERRRRAFSGGGLRWGGWVFVLLGQLAASEILPSPPLLARSCEREEIPPAPRHRAAGSASSGGGEAGKGPVGGDRRAPLGSSPRNGRACQLPPPVDPAVLRLPAMPTAEQARDFILDQLAQHQDGVSISELLTAAVSAALSTRVVKRVLHDEEARGAVLRDWSRRYHVAAPETSQEQTV